MQIRCAILVLVCCLVFSVSGQAKTILFDQGHGQKFTMQGEQALDLTNFAQLFASVDDLVTARAQQIDATLLADVDVLIISGAFSPFTQPELAAIQRFVYAGGRLCVMLHVGPLNEALLQAFNIVASAGVVKERAHIIGDNPGDFRTTKIAEHPILQELSAISVYGAWAVMSRTPDIQELVWSSPAAWLDLNRNQLPDANEPTGQWALALTGQFGKGDYIVFGDDAIFQNQFLVGDNLQLAKKLAEWLKR